MFNQLSSSSPALLIVINQGNANNGTSSVGAQGQQAAAKLADYMKQNNLSSLDMNSLHQLANNGSQQVPSDVAAAAQWMMQHPDVYQQIETHDVPGSDGRSGLGNFNWAAEGGLGQTGYAGGTAGYGANGGGAAADAGLGASSGYGGAGGSAGLDQGVAYDPSTFFNAEMAAGALAEHMQQQGMKTIDANQLYQLAMNESGDVPEGVSAAARYMLQNPQDFKQIETHDVAGSDGLSGLANLQWAANGGLGEAGRRTGYSNKDGLDQQSGHLIQALLQSVRA